jgi:hypothetical protein
MRIGANLPAFGKGFDLIDAFALNLFRGNALGDRVHRRAIAGPAVEGVGEYGPAVVQPGVHISKHRRKIVSLDFPDHQVALRLRAAELSIRKLEELRSDEAWNSKKVVNVLPLIPFQVCILLAVYSIAVSHKIILLLLACEAVRHRCHQG